MTVFISGSVPTMRGASGSGHTAGMSTLSPKPGGFARLLAWQRFVVVLIVGALAGLLQSPAYESTPTYVVMSRAMLVGIVALMAFGIFEQWPMRLPGWMA